MKQYNRFFLTWTWLSNRNFLKKIRPGRFIELNRDLSAEAGRNDARKDYPLMDTIS